MTDSGGPINDTKPDKPQQGGRESLIELIVIVATALILALLIQAFLVKPFRIPSISMVPTLIVGERVLVNRVTGRFGTPDRGDVTVFRPPAGADNPGDYCGVRNGQEYLPGKVYNAGDGDPASPKMACPKPTSGKSVDNYIKRVIGLPGERLKIVKGHAYINGKPLDEPYVNKQDSCDDDVTFTDDCNFELEITIPPGHYFMMGDNRNNSTDSRFWGPIPKQNVVGEAFGSYWPIKRIGPL